MSHKHRDHSYPPPPERLPSPVTDNHTHVEPGQLPSYPASSNGETAVAPAQLTLDEQVERAAAVNVARMVQCGCAIESARWTADVAVKNPAVVGAIAIHPNTAADILAGPDGERIYTEQLAEIAGLARANDRIRAIGETGLDFYRTGPEGHDAQIRAFRDHVALAKELGLAMQIHDRDAHEEIYDVLERDGAPERTVFHCFSGDKEFAERVAAKGYFLSFSGTVTFSANTHLREACAVVPFSRVLVETDAPYLTPQPFRGRPNAPYMVPTTMRTLAKVADLELDVACVKIEQNVKTVYGSW